MRGKPAKETPTYASPPLDVPLSESRVLRLRVVDTLVVLEVGTVVERCVRENLSKLGGATHNDRWRVVRTSESFTPSATLMFPLRVLGEVRRALTTVTRGARKAARQRTPTT